MVRDKYVVVVGTEHPLMAQMSQVFLDEGWTVFEAIEEDGEILNNSSDISAQQAWSDASLDDQNTIGQKTGKQRSAHQSKHRMVKFDPLNRQSIVAMAEQAKKVLDGIDMVVCCFNRCVESQLREGIDSNKMMEMYDYNALAPLRTMETLLPFMSDGMKRIGMISDARGRFVEDMGTGHIGYDMSLASRHMSIKIMSNALYEDGYTFRLVTLDFEKSNGDQLSKVAERICSELRDFFDNTSLKLLNVE